MERAVECRRPDRPGCERPESLRAVECRDFGAPLAADLWDRSHRVAVSCDAARPRAAASRRVPPLPPVAGPQVSHRSCSQPEFLGTPASAAVGSATGLRRDPFAANRSADSTHRRN